MPAVIWLLAQFAMSGILSRPADAAGLAGEIALSGDFGLAAVSLCTPDGEGNDLPGGMGGPDCQWCQAFGTAPELAPPADRAPIALDGKTLKFRILAAATLARLGVTTGFQSRAPPL